MGIMVVSTVGGPTGTVFKGEATMVVGAVGEPNGTVLKGEAESSSLFPTINRQENSTSHN